MIKLILKRIWIQRKSNAWLILNLFIISLLMVALVDALIQIKNSYIAPAGFEYSKESTYIMTCTRISNESDDVSPESIKASFNRLEALIRANPAVDKLSIYSGIYDGSIAKVHKGSAYRSYGLCIESDPEFFEIFRPKLLNRTDIYNDTFKESWNYNSEIRPLIISKDLADHNFFVDTIIDGKLKIKRNNDYSKLIGTIYETYSEDNDITYRQKIVGIVETTAYSNPIANLYLAYIPFRDKEYYASNHIEVKVLIKTKDGQPLSKDTFDLGSDSYHTISDIKLFDDYMYDEMLESDLSGIIYNFGLIALFFIFNLILGVFGSFWYRTVQRRSEIGLQMAIGATPIMMFRELFCEAILLLTIGFIPAFIISANQFYFNVALLNITNNVMTIDRFIVCALCTYVTMSALMFIAIIAPAIKAIKSNPAVALNSDK